MFVNSTCWDWHVDTGLASSKERQPCERMAGNCSIRSFEFWRCWCDLLHADNSRLKKGCLFMIHFTISCIWSNQSEGASFNGKANPISPHIAGWETAPWCGNYSRGRRRLSARQWIQSGNLAFLSTGFTAGQANVHCNAICWKGGLGERAACESMWCAPNEVTPATPAVWLPAWPKLGQPKRDPNPWKMQDITERMCGPEFACTVPGWRQTFLQRKEHSPHGTCPWLVRSWNNVRLLWTQSVWWKQKDGQ